MKKKTVLVVGGMKILHKTIKEMGFDRIYKPGTPIEETIIDLKKDFEVEK